MGNGEHMELDLWSHSLLMYQQSSALYMGVSDESPDSVLVFLGLFSLGCAALPKADMPLLRADMPLLRADML